MHSIPSYKGPIKMIDSNFNRYLNSKEDTINNMFRNIYNLFKEHKNGEYT
jgi:hypothetical protein